MDDLRQRDGRIAEIEAIPYRTRTAAQDEELRRLVDARDLIWRRLPDRIQATRARLRELEGYARQVRLPLAGGAQ
jgi:hypothetical protein